MKIQDSTPASDKINLVLPVNVLNEPQVPPCQFIGTPLSPSHGSNSEAQTIFPTTTLEESLFNNTYYLSLVSPPVTFKGLMNFLLDQTILPLIRH